MPSCLWSSVSSNGQNGLPAAPARDASPRLRLCGLSGSLSKHFLALRRRGRRIHTSASSPLSLTRCSPGSCWGGFPITKAGGLVGAQGAQGPPAGRSAKAWSSSDLRTSQRLEPSMFPRVRGVSHNTSAALPAPPAPELPGPLIAPVLGSHTVPLEPQGRGR